jgi:serine phosphatase RsbU (regulator of sigma subunit)
MGREFHLTKTRELEIINRVATTVGESLELDVVLDTALTEVMKAMEVNNGGIYLLDESTGLLTVKRHKNFTPQFLKEMGTVSMDQGCTGRAARTKEIFAGYGRPEKKYICSDAERLMGLDCLVAAPILFKGKVIGVLELFAPVSRRLTKKEAELLTSINNQIAIAIENAFSHQALKRALRDSELLLEAAQAITSILDINDILHRLVNLASELTHISRAAILLYKPETNELTMASSKGELPEKGTCIAFDNLSVNSRVSLFNGNIVIMDDFSNFSLLLQKSFSSYGIKSFMLVPLIYRKKLLGVLHLDSPGEKHVFDKEEIRLAEGIARQAATAIENAQAYQQQKNIADTLQKSFLPQEVPKIEGFEIGSVYVPASAGAMVGGDFYDFVPLGKNNMAILIGDVSGKGVETASLAGTVRNTIRVLTYENLSPTQVMYKANNLIVDQISRSQFITIFYALLNISTGKLVYINAGHPPALLLDGANGGITPLATGNPPIGVFPNQEFSQANLDLRKKDSLFIYTDGVTEARNDGNFFGQDRLEQQLVRKVKLKAQEIANSIISVVKNFAFNQLSDDIAIVVLQKK